MNVSSSLSILRCWLSKPWRGSDMVNVIHDRRSNLTNTVDHAFSDLWLARGAEGAR